MAQFKRYNLYWPTTVEAASMELDMIKEGGQWKKQNGEIAGEGLEYHYKRFVSIVWPWVVQHKWFDLILKHYLTHRTIVLIGPASSGKTFTSALLVLVDYFAHPDCTTVICCSTTKERLQDRVWADVTKLYRDAKRQYSWLSGNIIEGRLRIVTDSRKDSPDGRDFRNGCFPTGTLVDTPTGKVPIESLKIGDLVLNAIGVGHVKDTHSRTSEMLLRITLNDGRQIECTDEHPFFTDQGWKKARDLETLDMVFSQRETLQIMRENNSEQSGLLFMEMSSRKALFGMRRPNRKEISESKILLPILHDISSQYDFLRSMRKVIPSTQKSAWKIHWKILRKKMREHMVVNPPGNSSKKEKEMPALWEENDSSLQSGLLFRQMQEQARNSPMQTMWESVHFNPRITNETTLSLLRKKLQEESDWSGEFQKECESNSTRNESVETFSRIHFSSPYQHRTNDKTQSSPLVPSGHRVSRHKTGRRNKWGSSHNSIKDNQGQETERNTQLAWVESIEFLEQGSGSGFDESSKTYQVHNLSISGHPSYSVNGVIVHNCVGVPCKRGESFVGISDFAGIKNKRVRLLGDELSLLPRAFCDAISNLDKNPDFKCIGLGNPKDTTDALGVLGEPAASLGGWESGIDQQFGTKTWPIRREQGIAIQLPGDDSPNLDGTLGIPLISQADINRDISFYGKESMWFTMMDQGKMPRGQGSRRVLTRQLCMKYRAMDDPVWRDSNLHQIACLDAAYRGVGGDRCVFGILTFGYEVGMTKFSLPDSAIAHSMQDASEKQQVLALKELIIVPIDPGLDEPAEYQIAAFVKKQCEDRNIPPEDFFYDAGMRTSLVSALAKVWGSPGMTIDCGGQPTNDPVSGDIPTPCKDYYSKFVSQLWFTVRHAVESGQVRGFTEDVIMEFASREWMKVGNNKTEVEPKDKVKEKTGRSPDLADAVAIGIHGAIQRGFQIKRLKPDKPLKRGKDWRDELRQKAKAIWASGMLEYAEG